MANPDRVKTLERNLREIFGNRLQSLVTYRGRGAAAGAPLPSLAVVTTLSAADLRRAADYVNEWHVAGLATPLLLEAHEFERSLDAFPFEFGGIIADYAVVSGPDPFHGIRVDPADLRRACEIQARSHLLHLREEYVETAGRGDAIASLVQRSAAPLAVLLEHVERLGRGERLDPTLTRVAQLGSQAISPEDARRLFPDYLAAVQRLTNAIDHWSEA